MDGLYDAVRQQIAEDERTAYGAIPSYARQLQEKTNFNHAPSWESLSSAKTTQAFSRNIISQRPAKIGIGSMFGELTKDVGLGTESLGGVAGSAAGFAINPWLGAAMIGTQLVSGIWNNVNQSIAIANQNDQFHENLELRKFQLDKMWQASAQYGMASPFQSGPPGRINISGSNDGFVNMGSFAMQQI